MGGLVTDSSANLYGTTERGGESGYGTVFLLAPSTQKTWPETTLYDFSGGDDGSKPEAGVYIGTTGALYGSTSAGGSSSCGTVFQLAQSGETWTKTTLYTFRGGSDGCTPQAWLRPGLKEGTIFGTTEYGGSANDGTLFMLTEKKGVWTEKVLHAFAGSSDGAYPGDLDVDASGNVYGIVGSGGTHGAGFVFELPYGTRSLSAIYQFAGGDDGSTPVGIHFDRTSSTIYGTTTYGGTEGAGTVFELENNGNSWSHSVLHSFGSAANDGLYPYDRPTEDPTTGALYGTTLQGGQYDYGAVWQVTP